MPIFTHAWILGHLKGNMLSSNPKHFMAIEKGIRKRRFRGLEGVKGPQVVYLGVIVISWV